MYLAGLEFSAKYWKNKYVLHGPVFSSKKDGLYQPNRLHLEFEVMNVAAQFYKERILPFDGHFGPPNHARSWFGLTTPENYFWRNLLPIHCKWLLDIIWLTGIPPKHAWKGANFISVVVFPVTWHPHYSPEITFIHFPSSMNLKILFLQCNQSNYLLPCVISSVECEITRLVALKIWTNEKVW